MTVMGYGKEAELKKEAAADAEWFAERMASLVNELKTTTQSLRAQFLRTSMSSAMDFHERCTRAATTGTKPEDNF
jgi:hypothetical protein